MIPALLILLASLQVGDAATTIIGIRSGRASEVIPWMAWLFDKLGMVPAIALTKAVPLGLFIAAFVLGSDWLIEILAGACALYVGVVGWNLLQLKRSGLL